MNKIPMTVYGYKQLSKELKYLKKIRRSEIIKDIKNARKHGDLKENAEYRASKEQQKFCEHRINEIEIKLLNSQIIDVTKFKFNNRIIFGSTISIKNCNNKKIKTYRIVGDDESDIKKNLISVNSPISRGLIGKNLGDYVIIKTPSGEKKYKIINILYI
ncbi:MAG: transcription elongation factor GreA [gamma proteobacterium endosymbiont of Trioza apicalis]